MTSDSGAGMLIVEDDPNDLVFLERAFRKLGRERGLRAVTDGREAVDYLSGHGGYADRASYPIPDLIILDLKLPRMNGFEFLSWLRAHPALSGTAVVVLTSSEDRGDIERAKALGVLSYLIKPGGIERLVDCARAILAVGEALREGKPVAGRFP